MNQSWRESKGILAVSIKTSASLHQRLITIDKQTFPAVIHDEIRRIALNAVSSTYLHASLVRCTNQRENVKQDTIFVILGEDSKSNFIKSDQLSVVGQS